MASPSRPSSWAAMQRRIARRAGQVSSFQERPRLLEAAEDAEVWEEVLQSWPDVAQKLRPASRGEAECSDVPSLEELLPWIREALGANFVAENFHQLMPVAKVKQVPRDVRPVGTKTPPRLQLTGPKSLRQNLDKLMAALQGGQDHRNGDLVGIDRQPRTVARQHYDLNKDPTVAADEFTLATRKAERRLHARKLAQSERAYGDHGDHPAELQSPRRKHGVHRAASEAEEVRSHLLERLDYLHSCRGSMGESLYARQRQRLEMQAHLRTAQKYSLQEKPPEARCAYSAQVRGGSTKAWDPELQKALRPALRPQTAPELQGVPSRPFTPRSQMTKPPSPPKRETHDVEAVARTFNFARQCAAKKLPMPNLGTFTLGDESRLKLSNWSLGDDPLMALASSPLRDNVAVVEEGNFAGNRLTNKGVDAIVSSLGSDLTTLNLSANCFDGHGLESVLSFIRRAPKLTDINLSGNKLSDSSVSRLCLQLSQHCQSLQQLSLSDVLIGWDGDTAGASLGSLVTVLKMKNLDVSFNALHGQGAIEFLKSLPSSRLGCLDLSWNCLGKGAQSRSVAEEMSQVFQRCSTLQHLDISYNSFQSQELEILAKGLATNRTLWGLHIDGSGAVVDADAFLIPPVEFKPESNDPRAQSGRRKKSKSKTVLRMLHAAPVISLMELMPEGYENCFKNLTYFVEVDGFFTLPHAQESRFSSALECQQQCAKTYRCEHFSFWSSGGCLLTSYSSYPRRYDGPTTGSVVSGPRMCQAPPAAYRKKLPPGANVPPFVAKEAEGCGGLHAEYKLAWAAEGETFFDDWQFIEKSMTRGAEWYLNRSEAIYQSVAHASPAGAIIRVGEQVHPFKRRSLMLHSPQAWRPDVGFVVAMKYKHVPYGPGVWPAFWFLNSDRPWPSGGELDVLEFANDETAKVTFHTDQNCSLNVPKMLECSAQMTGVDPDMISSCLTNYSGNALGCMPPQVRRDGEWYSNNPGVLVTVWDASGITTFHIPEGQIPADLKADKPQPNTWPAIWRMAFMPFDPKTCVDIAHPQEIVLNIALCGDWAGNAWYSCKECKNTGFIPNYCIPGHVTEPATDCCTIYMSNPSAEEPLKTKAYFDIDYVKVFEPKGVKLPKYAAGTYRNGGVGVGDR